MRLQFLKTFENKREQFCETELVHKYLKVRNEHKVISEIVEIMLWQHQKSGYFIPDFTVH